MVQVTINDGILEGEVIDNLLGGKYCSFKGIPYAKPPLGDLRFKEPQPPQPWSGVRNANEHSPKCWQTDHLITGETFGSEDCLYINVYTPTINSKKPLAVMVWIHGGGFTTGSGDSDFYGPDFIIDKEVVLVTFNYRLEILGFLCLETEDVPGNAGMKDQVAALRWVKKNISNFGGDANNVTIFGESAGAGSVAYHLVSPMSKGLFQRAILQSGAITCSWATSFQPRQRAVLLAQQLGKYTNDDKELYEFFKNQPAENLLRAVAPISYAEKFIPKLDVQFSIVSEKQFGDNERFFYGHSFETVKNHVHDDVEIICGYNTDEGLLDFSVYTLDDITKAANEMFEYFVPKDMIKQLPLNKQMEVGEKMKKFYFKNEKVSHRLLDQLIKYLSMDFFTYGIIQMAKMYAKCNKSNIYLYKFNFISDRSLSPNFINLSFLKRGAVAHADDLGYLFNNTLIPLNKKSKGFEMIYKMTRLWTDFAKYGNPTPAASGQGFKWIPYTLDFESYLDISDQIKLSSLADNEEIIFWENMYKEYLPSHVNDGK